MDIEWNSLTDENPTENEVTALNSLTEQYELSGGGLASLTTYTDDDEVRLSISVFMVEGRWVAHILRAPGHPGAEDRAETLALKAVRSVGT